MRKRKQRREEKGAITVLVTFVLFLILSLLLVSLESARVCTGEALMEQNLTLAMESVLGEYYAPLFDQYGIYGVWNADPEAEVKRFMEAAAQPQKDLPISYVGPGESRYAYAYEITDVALEKAVMLTDGGGSVCRKQMIETGLLDGTQALAEELLDAANLLKSSEQTLDLMEQKMEAQSTLTEMEQEMLLLMQIVDGIPVDEQGICLEEGGSFTPEPNFVKCLVPGEITANRVKINRKEFYQCLQPRYLNGPGIAADMLQLAKEMTPDNRAELEAQLIGMNIQLRLAVRGSLEKTEEALPIVEELLAKQKAAAPGVRAYAAYLEKAKSWLSDEIYAELQSELQDMELAAGISEDLAQYDFAQMKSSLLKNREILVMLQKNDVKREENEAAWRAYMQRAESELGKLTFSGLSFDYTKVQTIRNEDSSAFDTICEFLLDGFSSGLFADAGSLSARRLSGTDLPSDGVSGTANDLFVIPQFEEEDLLSMDFLKKLMQGDGFGVLLDQLADTVEGLAEKLLLLLYLQEHFTSYTDETDRGALLYEKEYLVYGGLKDRNNVQSSAVSILGVRILMNLLHVFTSAEKYASTKTLVTGWFALAPIPAAIAVCQAIVLFVWGIQNALVETAALLQGKKVSFLVTERSFCVSLTEVFTLTRAARQQKAAQYVNANGFALDYDNYLLFFMLLTEEQKLTCRAMDLIQENMRCYHDPAFRLKDCYYGFGIRAEAVLPAMFTTISFGGFSPQTGTGYTYELPAAISY